MSAAIDGTTIKLTRGDSMDVLLNLKDADGEDYIPAEGDRVRFAMKRTYGDPSPALELEIPRETLVLSFAPGDTGNLPVGTYVYDIEVTLADGTVNTVIPGNPTERAVLILGNEVM